MPDQTQLAQSIYAAIFNGLGTAPAADTFITLEWPGMPVSDAEYGNPWTMSNTSGSPAATQALSLLADAIPNASAVYSISGLGVESVYSLILEATVSGNAVTAKVFADAQSKFANSALGSSLSADGSYHPSYGQPVTWTGNSQSGWTSVSVNLNASTSAPVPALEPHVATAVRATLASQAGATGWRSAPINLAALHRNVVPLRTVASVAALHHQPMMVPALAGFGEAHTMTAELTASHSASPAMIATAQGAVNRSLQSRVVSASLARPVPVSRTAVPPAVLERMNHLPNGEVVNHAEAPVRPVVIAQPVVAKPVTSSSLTLSMQVQRVNILREWMNPLLFRLGGWSLEGLAPGSLSTGTVDGNTGLFPLLPVAFLAIRNVSIHGTWSSDDKTYAGQATAAGSAVAFGPLTLSNAAASQSSFDGSTLTVPGMQIVAWICSPLPKMPPA